MSRQISEDAAAQQAIDTTFGCPHLAVVLVACGRVFAFVVARGFRV